MVVSTIPVYAASDPSIYINNLRLKQIGGVPAIIKNDRVFVPIRLVSEALGADVGWDHELQKVSICLQNGNDVTARFN